MTPDTILTNGRITTLDPACPEVNAVAIAGGRFVTVGAYMGGYHWTEIVLRPGLIYPFAFFALAVPAVNLHFFLVFPRKNPVLLAHRRPVLSALYGVPAAIIARTSA